MSYDAFVGEIMLFAGNFAPANFLRCDGQVLPIAQHATLFSVLGTRFGGDGVTTFALPDLRGRVPIGFGEGPGLSPIPFASGGGRENISLTVDNLPWHAHSLFGDPTGSDETLPTDRVLGASTTGKIYSLKDPAVDLHAGSIAPAGSGVPFENRKPFLAITFCICFIGPLPSRN